MILSAGDSFATHKTPLPDKYETQLGHSVSELIANAYDTDVCDAGWPGASLDATVYKAIAKIEEHTNINLVLFNLTDQSRYMYSTDTSKNLDLGPDFFYDDSLLEFQGDHITSWMHGVTDSDNFKEATDYYLRTAHYKLYYDYDAYLCLLTNYCKLKNIPILFVDVHSNNRKTTTLLIQDYDKVSGPIVAEWTADRIGNHLYPEEHLEMFKQIMVNHKEFLDHALSAKY